MKYCKRPMPLISIGCSRVTALVLQACLRRVDFFFYHAYHWRIETLVQLQKDLVPGIIFLEERATGMSPSSLHVVTFVRLLRSSPRFDQTQLIVFTQRTHALARWRILHAGATRLLQHPIRTDDIVAIAIAREQSWPDDIATQGV